MTPLRQRAEQVFSQLHTRPYYNEDMEADIAAIHAALEQVVEDCARVVEKQLEVPLPNETVEIVQFIAHSIRQQEAR